MYPILGPQSSHAFGRSLAIFAQNTCGMKTLGKVAGHGLPLFPILISAFGGSS